MKTAKSLNIGMSRKGSAGRGAALDAVSSGDEVALAGFGKFSVKSRPARKGRNPATGEAIKIAATKRLAFSAAKAAKEAINSPKRKRARK